MDALADPQGDGGCERCATRDKEAQGVAEEFKRRIMDIAYRHQLQRAVIIEHEFDQLRDAAAEHGAEALLVAVRMPARG
jgi:hypothetical protein